MFGLPGETIDQVIQTAALINSLPIHNVKIHNLHVLKNTPLAQDFGAGQFQPIEFEEYMERVKVFLQHLNPKVAVHRLAANATRSEELIAPKWTGDKMRTYQAMIDHLKETKSYQGQFYGKHTTNPLGSFDTLSLTDPH